MAGLVDRAELQAALDEAERLRKQMADMVPRSELDALQVCPFPLRLVCHCLALSFSHAHARARTHKVSGANGAKRYWAAREQVAYNRFGAETSEGDGFKGGPGKEAEGGGRAEGILGERLDDGRRTQRQALSLPPRGVSPCSTQTPWPYKISLTPGHPSWGAWLCAPGHGIACMRPSFLLSLPLSVSCSLSQGLSNGYARGPRANAVRDGGGIPHCICFAKV